MKPRQTVILGKTLIRMEAIRKVGFGGYEWVVTSPDVEGSAIAASVSDAIESFARIVAEEISEEE